MSENVDPHRVNPDGLATKLRDWQVLNWRIEHFDDGPRKIPKQPSNPNGPNAKSNDGSTWGPFDKALQNATENDDLGLGFPCAQPGHPFVFVDVDIPDSDEWVPPFDRLGGAIVERSPSGGSRRIILTGCEAPEWWTDQSDPGKDVREVKVFDSTGYVTLTGDTVDGFGTPLERTHSPALEQWLKEAWFAFNSPEDDEPLPWGDDTSDATPTAYDDENAATIDGEEWLDAETAETALGEIDPDIGHDEWIGVGFALANHFGRSTGGHLFKQWSRGGSKWDKDAAESVIDDAGDYPHDIRHFVNVAKDHGWDASAAAREAVTASDGGVEAATPSESTDLNMGTQPLANPDGEASLPDPTPYGFARHNGGYGYWDSAGDDQPDEWTEWTNFEIEVTSYLTMDADGSEEIALTIHPRHGESYEVRVLPTAFNENRQFKSEVACGRTTTFTGGEHALAKIKVFVGTQAAPDQTGVNHMGRRGDSLVVPGGSLTADGWDESPDTRYVERSLGIERKVGLTPDCETAAANDVSQILELLPQTRDYERFLPALGWFYATPLRPFVTDLTGEFPVLSITGNTGAGKTSTLETMWSLLGIEGDPFSANDTTFTAMTTVSSTDTLPVWFDEYKPSDMHPGRLDGFHDLIRKSTRGGVVSKGNADQTTTEYHLRAPVCISGEQRFAGPAEQRRSILTTFRESATDPDGDAAHAFAKLSGGSHRLADGHIKHYEGYDLLAHAHAYHRWQLSYDLDDVRKAWREAEERVLSLLEDYGIGDVDSAGRTALQTVAFGLGLYRAFADEMGASVPFDAEDRDRALIYIAKQQGNDGRRESHLDEFIRYLSLAAMENDLEEDRHYTRVYAGEGKGEIRVNMSKAYPKVTRYLQNHGLASNAEQLGEGDYRQRIKEASEETESYITTYSQKSPPAGRAFGIDIADATEAVEGFDPDNFYGRDEQGENGRYGSDENHWRSDN